MINFSQSYYSWKTRTKSYGRFNLESVCTVSDKNGRAIDSICALYGVMACDVYGKAPLFYEPPFYYQALFSDSKVKIIRNFIPHQQKDSTEKIAKTFEEVKKHINYIDENRIHELSDYSDVKNCLLQNKSLNAMISYEKRQYKYELQFPVKHINCSAEKEEFQVETGPLVMMNTEGSDEDFLNNSLLAYVAFNNYHEASFLFYSIEKMRNGEEIRHFSKQQQINCNISLVTY